MIPSPPDTPLDYCGYTAGIWPSASVCAQHGCPACGACRYPGGGLTLALTGLRPGGGERP